MLEQQELVADARAGSVIDEPLLERVRLAVLDATEPSRVQRNHAIGGRAKSGTRFDEGCLHARTIAGERPHPAEPAGWPSGTGPGPPTGSLQNSLQSG